MIVTTYDFVIVHENVSFGWLETAH